MRFEITLSPETGTMQAALVDGDREAVLLALGLDDHCCDFDDERCMMAVHACLDVCELRVGTLAWQWPDPLEDDEAMFAWTPELNAAQRRAVRDLIDSRCER
jgi:hypothetical protein